MPHCYPDPRGVLRTMSLQPARALATRADPHSVVPQSCLFILIIRIVIRNIISINVTIRISFPIIIVMIIVFIIHIHHHHILSLHFSSTCSESFLSGLREWKVDTLGLDYIVVSVLGVQSSGKSTQSITDHVTRHCFPITTIITTSIL